VHDGRGACADIVLIHKCPDRWHLDWGFHFLDFLKKTGLRRLSRTAAVAFLSQPGEEGAFANACNRGELNAKGECYDG